MPRLQVYLPADLYKVLKARRLPASELLQQAVRAEVRREALLAATDRYLDTLVERVGAPTVRDQQRAAAVVARAGTRAKRKAG
jgi:post-segregation antitoxin (ccd killing protein)